MMCNNLKIHLVSISISMRISYFRQKVVLQITSSINKFKQFKNSKLKYHKFIFFNPLVVQKIF
jgi:hypothetical protein